ncbi:MAG: hypothetical protein ACI9UN_001496 [Granulosicoccus sp.]|jgi:uncharacterized protein YigA (DUF484 family)
MQPEQSDLSNVLTDEAVLRFLTTNPEFFVKNQDVLPRLRIPHESGKAVSLIERQVSVLRSKCGTLENSLRDLISVARENENLHQRLHVLLQDIVSALSLEDIVALTRNSLRENFNADEVHILLVADKVPRAKTRKKSATADVGKAGSASAGRAAATRRRKLNEIEGLRVIPQNDKHLELFAELFESGQTQCGLPAAQHLECFVGKNSSNIASAALMPLYHERQLGVVMLTSRDESRFSAGKGVMFLNQLGELLSRRLHSYGAIAAVTKK